MTLVPRRNDGTVLDAGNQPHRRVSVDPQVRRRVTEIGEGLEADTVQLGQKDVSDVGDSASSVVRNTLLGELLLLADHAQPENHQHDRRQEHGDQEQEDLPAVWERRHDDLGSPWAIL